MKIKLWLVFSLIMPLKLMASVWTFEYTVNQALENDPSIKAWTLESEAWQKNSDAQVKFSNPNLSFGVINAAVEGFDLDSQNMTQQQLKLTQKLPKKGSFDLRKSLALQSKVQSLYMLENQMAQTQSDVGALWADIHWLQTKIQILTEQQSNLKLVAEVVKDRYQSGNPSVTQSDVLQTQLVTEQIESELLLAEQMKQKTTEKLLPWISTIPQSVSGPLPELEFSAISDTTNHPKNLLAYSKIESHEITSQISQLKNKPQWQLSAAYGKRLSDPMGNTRDDLLSITASVDLPWFNKNRFDAAVSEKVMKAEAARLFWQKSIQSLNAALQQSKTAWQTSQKLIDLHANKLIPQSAQIKQATAAAFQSGEGSLTDWLAAQNQWLNLKLKLAQLQNNEIKQKLKIIYLQHQGASS